MLSMIAHGRWNIIIPLSVLAVLLDGLVRYMKVVCCRVTSSEFVEF